MPPDYKMPVLDSWPQLNNYVMTNYSVYSQLTLLPNEADRFSYKIYHRKDLHLYSAVIGWQTSISPSWN